MSLLSVYVIGWIALFVCVSLIDLKYFILPDWITLPLIVSGVVFNTFSENQFCSGIDSLLGIVIGYGLIRLVDEFYFRLKKLRGIGQGDAKLLAAIGSILGWQAIFPILCLASILGVLVGLYLIRVKRLTIQQRIPFGPFLSLFACAWILEKLVPLKF